MDGDHLYVLAACGSSSNPNDSQGELACLEAATGKIVWQKSLKGDLNGQMMSGWGYSESPLVDGDKLICSPGGAKGTLAALDKKTGEVIWRSKELTDPAAYSSIIAAEVGGVRQYIQTTGRAIVGVRANDGKLLWRQVKSNYRTAVIPTPIFYDNCVYTTAGYGVGCDLLKLTPDGQGTKAEEIYDKDAMRAVENKHEAVVRVGDHIYGWTDRGSKWVCQEFKTGKIVWESKKLGRGSITCADGRLYCFGEHDGTVVLVEASPEGWKEHGRFTIPTPKMPKPKVRNSDNVWTRGSQSTDPVSGWHWTLLNTNDKTDLGNTGLAVIGHIHRHGELA